MVGGMQNGAAALENSLEVPQILNIELPCDSAIPFLHRYLREMRKYIHIKTCTWIVTAVLFMIAKTIIGKCPWNDE